jgi:hypothetical protein
MSSHRCLNLKNTQRVSNSTHNVSHPGVCECVYICLQCVYALCVCVLLCAFKKKCNPACVSPSNYCYMIINQF